MLFILGSFSMILKTILNFVPSSISDCHLNITETCYFDFEPVSVSFILFISSTPLDYAGHYLCVLVYVY